MYSSFLRKFELVFIWGLFFCLFFLIIIFVSDQDIRTHAVFATEMLKGERQTSGNFLLYWLINVFSLFSTKKIPSLVSVCVLIAAAETLRYYLSKKYLESAYYNKPIEPKKGYTVTFLALTTLIIFLIPLPQYLLGNVFYFGGYAPNVWHNSTILFVFPFAGLLAYFSFLQLTEFSGKREWILILLIFLNVFIKPSYFFVFTIVYPFACLVSFRFSIQFWKRMVPVFVGIIMLIIEYYLIYIFGSGESGNSSGVALKIRDNLPSLYTIILELLSILFSLFFPIIYYLLNYKKLNSNKLFLYLVISEVVALLIFYLFTETGVRAKDGNFYWQIVPCTWFLYIFALKELIADINKNKFTLKNKVLSILYAAHFFLGIIYYIRLFITDTYM